MIKLRGTITTMTARKKTTPNKSKKNINTSKIKRYLAQTSKSFRIAIMVVVMLGFGAIGYIMANASSAATPRITSSSDCFMALGRIWDKSTSTCLKKCAETSGSLVVSSPYDYCSKAASKISYSICNSKNRVYKYGVCLKEWDRRIGVAGYTYACKYHTWKYRVASPYDYCYKG